ncbi:MAG: MGDG synthase family glycosyltransferase [Vulcanimicrobiaceae bacterium]
MSAANAVCAVLRDIDPAARTHVVDSYQYAALVVSRIVSDGYVRMVKTIPQMYRYIYDRAERATEVGPFRTWAHQFTAGNLRPLIERERPDVVVCTHAFPCGAMAEYKKLYADAPPVIGIITDFAVHGFWIHANVDGYAVSTEAIREIMLARGVEPSRIEVTGIPVNPRFAPSGEPRGFLRERLGLPLDRELILMMGGGLGIGPLAGMLRSLDRVEARIGAVVIAGNSARVERRVVAAAASVPYPVRVLRFVENVYDYMHACDAFVTKPGGLSTAEALCAQIPMVLCKPLPGQEERNAELLVEWGAAVRARRMTDLAGELTRVLGSAQRDEIIGAQRRTAHPQAALAAAHLIARIAREQKEPVPA